jgi:hypothetical protein
VTPEQIEQLRLQRRTRSIGVEVGEERVVRIFEDERRIEPRREALRERRLADADRPFNRDVAKLQRARSIAAGFGARQATGGVL